jgi:hypothetical protein
VSTGWPGRTAHAARRRLGRAVCATWFVGGLAALLGGCGPGLYLASMRPAARAVERAHEAGAEELATYDYYFALAHLDKAREEAAESAFQDAADHARIAREHAERAEATSRGATTAP